MGIWSSPVAIWPAGLHLDISKVSPETRDQLQHCVTFGDDTIDEVKSGDDTCCGSIVTGEHFMSTSMICDTAKIIGYLSIAERRAWASILDTLADCNSKDLIQHGIILYFYCHDHASMFAFYRHPNGVSHLYHSTMCNGDGGNTGQSDAAMDPWKEKHLVAKSEDDEDDEDDGDIRIDLELVKSAIKADPHFGSVHGSFWNTCMKKHKPPSDMLEMAKQLGISRTCLEKDMHVMFTSEL